MLKLFVYGLTAVAVGLALAILFLGLRAAAGPALLPARAPIVYRAVVVKVIDGDTLKVRVGGWPAPFDPIDVRVFGVDTPEHVKPPAQADCEVALGVKAMVYGRALVTAGQTVTLTWSGLHDKYGRLLASVALPDGRDWAGLMIAGGYGRAYGAGGGLHKAGWC